MNPGLESRQSQMKVNLVINEDKLGVVGWYGFSYSFNIQYCNFIDYSRVNSIN
jgi:hypothetical protein